MDNTHNKILTELKSGKYYLSYLENKLNIPKHTLSEATAGKRNIPSKYFDVLIKELKL
jgi:hypothetical protein